MKPHQLLVRSFLCFMVAIIVFILMDRWHKISEHENMQYYMITKVLWDTEKFLEYRKNK